MKADEPYDVAIIGGGLAGLALSIQLVNKNYSVALFERERYPFHKVCGEYISMESWDFLQSLGLPLRDMNLPKVDTLYLTAPNGKSFTTYLPLGGFGISRYAIDNLLSKIAKEKGVHLFEESKVENVNFDQNFSISYSSHNTREVQQKESLACCSAFGKRSNLDVKWKRSFLSKNNSRINNYVAVKYHVRTKWPANVIGLHNFKDGYCGISQIEDGQYCLCYLTTADNLKRSGNSIEKMQDEILFKNPVLKKIFSSSEFLFQTPLTISQVSFSKKTLVENNILMIGDAAGMITPLCGNGMSMALHSSKLAAYCIDLFLKNAITREQMELQYQQQWNHQFSKRIMMGRRLQSVFGSELVSNLFVSGLNLFPFLAKGIIRKTHGKPF
jgi:menaquinone-9 beta-reductase